MRLIVAGSRYCNNYKLVSEMLDAYIRDLHPGEVEIVSGGQRGVDSIAEEYATKKGYKFKLFPADWNTHGKASGPIRNKEMAQYGTHCIIFTSDGPGSRSMEWWANKYKLNPLIVSV